VDITVFLTASAALKMKCQFIGVEQMDYISVGRFKKVLSRNILTEKKGVMQYELCFVSDLHFEYSKLRFGKGGISQTVNWKGGCEFVYLELKKHNQNFIKQIKSAKDPKVILGIWEDMTEKSFLNHNVDLQKQEAHIEDFKKLPLKEQK